MPLFIFSQYYTVYHTATKKLIHYSRTDNELSTHHVYPDKNESITQSKAKVRKGTSMAKKQKIRKNSFSAITGKSA